MCKTKEEKEKKISKYSTQKSSASDSETEKAFREIQLLLQQQRNFIFLAKSSL